MTAPGNLSFETVGGGLGFADRWSLRGRASADLRLAFGSAPTVGPLADPNELDGASWTPLDTGVGADTDADPDGNVTADQLADVASTNYHAIENSSVALADESTYGLAAFLKDFTRGFGGLGFGLGTANETTALFDLTDGFASAVVRAGGISKASAAILDVGDGWFLCELFITTSAPIASIKPAILLSDDGLNVSYLGVGFAILAWGAALFDMPRDSFESFERWAVYDTALVIGVDAVPAVFTTSFVDPNGFEDFESAWANYPFLTTNATATTCLFDEDGTPEAVEDFEEGWGITTLETVLTSPTAALFDEDGTPEAFEDFEDGWLTSAFITVLSGTAGAQWDGDLAESVEDFEGVLDDKIYTVVPGTGVFTSTAHGYSVSAPLYVLQPDGGNLPSGLNPTIEYWPVTVTANTFKLSLTSGGAAIATYGDAGVGVQKIRAAARRFWNGDGGINHTLG